MYLNFSFCFQVIKLKPEIELCNIYEWCNEALMIILMIIFSKRSYLLCQLCIIYRYINIQGNILGKNHTKR